MDAALPVNEAQRLVALRSLNILDTPSEERFERITRTAAGVFGVPIAALTLVDANRRWYKASVGLPERETPRDHAFCAHVLRAGEPLAIANVGADERYSDNPAVRGEPFIRFYAGHPLHSQAGLALGTLCIMDRVPRDFDERDGAVLRDLAAWAEDELNSRDLVRERELGRLQADLISTVAHELRTPLTAIMGYSDMLDGAEPGDTVTEYATIIRSNAQRLNALVSNLQDLSRIEAGQIKLQMQSVHVPDLVRNVLYTLEPEYLESGHRLHLDLAEDLPPVHADRRRLEQVITSLVSNAHKYTPSGGEIWVSAEA
ncbi:MAG: GAF domain-containing protein, partial [Candidatus Dormibacteraeota bacterium]|nr:GAF domain-containing protein [Candidatus Dormibacteraeota bacterium]